MARLLSVSGSVSLALLGCLCGLSACKNQPPPAAEASAEPTPAPPAASVAAAVPSPAAAPAEPAAAAAASKYSEAPFDVEIQPKGSYTSGQA